MAKISPFLWYSDKAEEAARFYCSLLPDSRINSVVAMQADSPAGPPGSVIVVDFVLAGMAIQAMSAGPLDPFNHAVSFVIHCDDQAEIDRLWQSLGEGGSIEECGWLKDRYGLCWQIVPTVLDRMMGDSDPVRAKRVAEAMLKMVKLDIAKLEAAFDGA